MLVPFPQTLLRSDRDVVYIAVWCFPTSCCRIKLNVHSSVLAPGNQFLRAMARRCNELLNMGYKLRGDSDDVDTYYSDWEPAAHVPIPTASVGKIAQQAKDALGAFSGLCFERGSTKMHRWYQLCI